MTDTQTFIAGLRTVCYGERLIESGPRFLVTPQKPQQALKAGDAQNASTTALQAQAMFARSGRKDSEWHAWLIAARAGNEPETHDYASRAAGLLSELQQKWGPEVYGSYLSRPDIESCRQRIDQILAKRK